MRRMQVQIKSLLSKQIFSQNVDPTFLALDNQIIRTGTPPPPPPPRPLLRHLDKKRNKKEECLSFPFYKAPTLLDEFS